MSGKYYTESKSSQIYDNVQSLIIFTGSIEITPCFSYYNLIYLPIILRNYEDICEKRCCSVAISNVKLF